MTVELDGAELQWIREKLTQDFEWAVDYTLPDDPDDFLSEARFLDALGRKLGAPTFFEDEARSILVRRADP